MQSMVLIFQHHLALMRAGPDESSPRSQGLFGNNPGKSSFHRLPENIEAQSGHTDAAANCHTPGCSATPDLVLASRPQSQAESPLWLGHAVISRVLLLAPVHPRRCTRLHTSCELLNGMNSFQNVAKRAPRIIKRQPQPLAKRVREYPL